MTLQPLTLSHPVKFSCVSMLLKAYSGIELSNYFIVPIFLKSQDISQVLGLATCNDSIKDWIMTLKCLAMSKLGNSSSTHFQANQAARSRRVSHAVFILPSVLWCNQQTTTHLVLRPKPRNCCGDFVGQITKPQMPVLRPKAGNPSQLF
jgi:hypothetical protein